MHAIYSHTHNLGKSSCRLIWFQYIEPLHVLLILSYLQDLASLKVPYMEQLISLMLSQIMHLISQMCLLLCALRRSSKYQFHSFWSDSTWARTHDLQHSKWAGQPLCHWCGLTIWSTLCHKCSIWFQLVCHKLITCSHSWCHKCNYRLPLIVS